MHKGGCNSTNVGEAWQYHAEDRVNKGHQGSSRVTKSQLYVIDDTKFVVFILDERPGI